VIDKIVRGGIIEGSYSTVNPTEENPKIMKNRNAELFGSNDPRISGVPPPTLKEIVGGKKGLVKLIIGAIVGAALLWAFLALGLA